MGRGGRRRNQPSMKVNLKVARKFWHYMQDSKKYPTTRKDLRDLHKVSFCPMLTDASEQKVKFCAILWCFRSKHLKIIQWTATGDRDNIVYKPGRRPTEETEEESVDLGFARLKQKLVEERDRKDWARNKGGVSIEPESDEKSIVHMNVSSKILKLTVVNQLETHVTLQCGTLGMLGPFQVEHGIHKEIVHESKRVRLEGKQQTVFDVKLTKSLTHPGIYSLPVAFRFARTDEKESIFYIIKYIQAAVDDNIVKEIREQSMPYQPPKRVYKLIESNDQIEHGEPPSMATASSYIVPLPSYRIPPHLESSMKTDRLFEAFEDEENDTPEKYSEKFSKLLHVEELQMKLDIEKYQMRSAKLIKEFPYLTLAVPGLAENRPSLVRGDRLFVKKLAANGSVENENIKCEGYVHKVGLNKVFLKFSVRFHREFMANSSFQVNFEFSRTSLRLMHRAVENAAPFLDLIPLDGQPSEATEEPIQIRYFDRKIEENGEQKQAVENIVAGTSKPYPYLVFGPPGTGKTVTIVEAIKQVLRNYPDSRILACAPSNSAADLILERVAQHNVVPKTKMVRLNAFGRHKSSVSEKILDMCILDREDRGDGGDFFVLPSKADIEGRYKLVVTTLITAGRLVSLGIPKSHFTHVFIDEAGQGMEPECLVPIAGLLGTDENNLGQLVLAGDPKQLGPVLRSPVAIEHGLRVSLLERLMGTYFSCYERQPADDQYDPKCVTKLLNNYRSHPEIIKVPNELFYGNELRACADELQREALCHWSGLKKKGFPVIFKAVWGKDEREEESPSFFNPEEISAVLQYVEQLTEARGLPLKMNEIGIISPYHRQVKKIREELRKRLGITQDSIKVGSVEEFQGQERKVIIISTVRSSEEFLQLDAQHKLGFLDNPKRFNVAITRAKALLIVIGNPSVLCHDKHWKKFIMYCIDNEAFFDGFGSRPSENLFQPPKEADVSLEKKLAKLSLNETTLIEKVVDATGPDDEVPWRPSDE